MFDFEKLLVYQKSKSFYLELLTLTPLSDKVIDYQLRRAALSILLNIAEGAGRNTKPDQRRFYTIARGSLFECASILDVLNSRKIISQEKKDYYYKPAEEISKMLYSMIRKSE